jgi:predicted XRE-type DNA-binding protein
MLSSKKTSYRTKANSRLQMHKSSGNVFSDMGFSDSEAASLLIRGHLMIEIERVIKANRWTQAKAAEILGVTQPRISEIFSDRVDLFAIDTLVRYLSLLGKDVCVTIKDKKIA